MVDSLGDLQVGITQDILNVPAGWSTFQAGEQTLDGKQTPDYVRLLNPTGRAYPSEWDRLSRQNLVAEAITNLSVPQTGLALHGVILCLLLAHASLADKRVARRFLLALAPASAPPTPTSPPPQPTPTSPRSRTATTAPKPTIAPTI